MGKSQKILITGPESSGKTSLVLALAEHFGALYVPEYARVFLERGTRSYDWTDYEIMANSQYKLFTALARQHNGYLISDTGPVVLAIWGLEKFGEVPRSTNQWLENWTFDHVLLCKPNIPWERDALRENPNDRDRLYARYIDFMQALNLPFSILDEEGKEARLQHAIDRICT